MSIKIAGYVFDGPFFSTHQLEDKSGVYVILCKKNNKYIPIDVGESSAVKSRVEKHDRKDCWKINCREDITYAVHYTPNLQQSGRKEIEKIVRDKYKFPCGDY